MKEVIIDRATWVNGSYGYESKLLNSKGEKCCLGFLGNACGYSDSQIKGIVLPWSYLDGNDSSLWPSTLFDRFGFSIANLLLWHGCVYSPV